MFEFDENLRANRVIYKSLIIFGMDGGALRGVRYYNLYNKVISSHNTA